MLGPLVRKAVYMTLVEQRFISQSYELVFEGLHLIEYKRYFDTHDDKYKGKPTCDWYRYTINSYYTKAVGNWCMIFGGQLEPTHYYKLLEIDSFAQCLNLNTEERKKN